MIFAEDKLENIIENNWSSDIEDYLKNFFNNDGRQLVSDDFEYPPDIIENEELTAITLVESNVENGDFGKKSVEGVMRVDVRLTGYLFSDKSYRGLGSIELSVPLKFTFDMDSKGNLDGFQCYYDY